MERIERLIEIWQQNNDVAWKLCDYLNNTPCLITKELMERANYDGILSEEMVYCALLSVFCGLDAESTEYDRQLEMDYFLPAIKKLSIETYTYNPYYQRIKIPETTFEHWKLTYQKYQPYEAFIYIDLIEKPDFRKFPGIGFFDEEFSFPTVMENNSEWMSIKPSEIETTQFAIDAVSGNVVTFGLGLGYYAYMVSCKKEVNNITVIEKDPEVIRLFKQIILPQFDKKEKVDVVCADAFEYVEREMEERAFDYAFVDLWHDVSDGLELYLRMKNLEHRSPVTKFLYWVEDSLLSGLQWQIFDSVIQNSRSYEEVRLKLGKESLKEFALNKTLIIKKNKSTKAFAK